MNQGVSSPLALDVDGHGRGGSGRGRCAPGSAASWALTGAPRAAEVGTGLILSLLPTPTCCFINTEAQRRGGEASAGVWLLYLGRAPREDRQFQDGAARLVPGPRRPPQDGDAEAEGPAGGRDHQLRQVRWALARGVVASLREHGARRCHSGLWVGDRAGSRRCWPSPPSCAAGRRLSAPGQLVCLISARPLPLTFQVIEML